MTAIDRAREWLACVIMAAGGTLAGLVCPHRYGSLAKDITDPPFMALWTAMERFREWYRKRYRKLN